MLNELIEGYRRYRNGWSEAEQELYRQLVTEGQAPKVMIIACCDSRVDPSIILSAKPGSLFMVRNVGNLVPPYEVDDRKHGTSAALEYAVRVLKVEHVIVLGHAHCGGIRALFEAGADDSQSFGDFILPWMRIVTEAKDHVHDACTNESPAVQCRLLEQEAIRVSLRNLRTFPWIVEAEKNGELHLHGWYYGLAEGELMALDAGSNTFRSLLDDRA